MCACTLHEYLYCAMMMRRRRRRMCGHGFVSFVWFLWMRHWSLFRANQGLRLWKKLLRIALTVRLFCGLRDEALSPPWWRILLFVFCFFKMFFFVTMKGLGHVHTAITQLFLFFFCFFFRGEVDPPFAVTEGCTKQKKKQKKKKWGWWDSLQSDRVSSCFVYCPVFFIFCPRGNPAT